VLSASFVYDDFPYVVENPLVTEDGVTLLELLTQPFPCEENSLGWYRPLTVLSYRVNAWGSQLDGPAFHLVNLVLHLVVTALVFVVGCRLLSSLTAAGSAALLFALLPGHAEAVLWISGRSEVLACLLSMLALLLVISSPSTKRASLLSNILAATCFALALLAKESAVTLLPVVVVLAVDSTRDASSGRTSWRHRSGAPALLLLVFVGYLVLRWLVVGAVLPAANEGAGATLGQRLALSGRVWWQAALSLSGCSQPTPEYFWLEPLRWTWRSLVGWGLVVLAVWSWVRSRQPALRIGISVMVLGFGIYAHLLASTELFAERFLYFPSVGLCLVVGAGVQALEQRVSPGWVLALVAAVGLSAGASTVAYAGVWQDDFTLWRYTASASDSPLAWCNYATTLASRGEYAWALDAYRHAINDPLRGRDAKIGILRVLGSMGKAQQGIAFARQALVQYPNDPEILYLQGRHYLLANKRAAAQQVIDTLHVLKGSQPQAGEWASKLEQELPTGKKGTVAVLPALASEPAPEVVIDQ